MKVRRKSAYCGVPTKHAACSAGFQNADACGVCMAQLHDQFGTSLEHAAWIVGHLLGQQPKRSAFGLIVGGPSGANSQFTRDQNLIEARYGIGTGTAGHVSLLQRNENHGTASKIKGQLWFESYQG
jgi:hypothetical protein